MNSFISKKNSEDCIKDGLIITIGATGIFFGLKALNVKPPGVSLGATDIVKLIGRICVGVLGKDYAAYKKWIKELYNKNFMAPKGL